MAAERENHRPYRESGRFAQANQNANRRRLGLIESLNDADALETRAVHVTRRGARNQTIASLSLLACLALCAVLVPVALAQPPTYEGAVFANWSILGVVSLMFALNFLWAWRTRSSELVQTGHHLKQRAEYQRRLAASQLTEGCP